MCFTVSVDLPAEVQGLLIAIPKAAGWPTQRNVTYLRKDFPAQMRCSEKKVSGCEYFLFTAGSMEGGGDLTFEQVFECDTYPLDERGSGREAVDRNRLNQYLRSEYGIETTSSRIRALATKTARKGEPDLDNAGRIYRWLQTNLTYSRKPCWPVSALKVLDERRGDCAAQAVLLTALCRAAGIPTRIVAGFQKNEMGNLHVWNECWIEGRGWVPVDAAGRRFGGVPAGTVIMSKGSHLCLHPGKFMSPQIFQIYCYQYEGGAEPPKFDYRVTISDGGDRK